MFIIPHELLYPAALAFVLGFVIATIFDTMKDFGFIKAFICGETISWFVVSVVYLFVTHNHEVVMFFTTNVKIV